ncbi:hypothetical protein L198_08309 [Cryptococcus wingfieldii CBS 7118]|uniref:Uncharacterized protein n=1 Tax=Cryptococcus wingfieldii CBS 7118 TaxID=1295528 RepID=A0A1E3H9R7_9TREE|nr:hypothetical protein L198_08310 [Cryptococcus wingfieldii CBS 7118]XP_019027748.1 hypothetical protein L198_08309 [Cryptococcus wingfieldii CBS 7118]ODN73087.1 hypothetical protein L198_08310 [Cryptococcus wingfieldii CBS 7118]ODN73094.1 hypothetical protein L198_08309 [Cryptococcus wingfieldii CBS 7118]
MNDRCGQTSSSDTHPAVLLPASSPSSHPFAYARVVGLYNANVFVKSKKEDIPKYQLMPIALVEELDLDKEWVWGFEARRLPRVRARPKRVLVYTWIDPSMIIRGCHLIPVVSSGEETEPGPVSSLWMPICGCDTGPGHTGQIFFPHVPCSHKGLEGGEGWRGTPPAPDTDSVLTRVGNEQGRTEEEADEVDHGARDGDDAGEDVDGPDSNDDAMNSEEIDDDQEMWGDDDAMSGQGDDEDNEDDEDDDEGDTMVFFDEGNERDY